MNSLFARVIVDITNANVDRLFTYSVPEDMNVIPGHRVLVPFGKGNRKIEGFVVSISDTPETTVELKEIIKTMEPYTVLLEEQLQLAEWICVAYHCTRAEALRGMLPAVLRNPSVKEKTVRTVRIAEGLDISAAAESMKRKDGSIKSPRQFEVFELLANSALELTVPDINAYIPNSSPAISALIKKGILVESGRVTFRSPFAGTRVRPSAPPALTAEQKSAYESIINGKPGECFLLHGVTGSGKTEVYLQVIEDAVKKGMGAIVLVPEISLTPQTTDRFRSRFGDSIAVLHSHLGDGERYDEWRRIRFGKARIVVGARSALFAPVENLGIIIIDEEHEPSYQSELTPKYSAVEVALRISKFTGARLVLGSATPSLTDYYRARTGKFRLLEMPTRINSIPMPKVDVIDMRNEFMSGNVSIFSSLLASRLGECLENGEQSILFLNRRGYSSHAECRACGFVFTCPNCDVALTYHKYDETIRCHYCGAVYAMPKTCPSCGQEYIKYTGIGTQQVEEQLKKLFPSVRCLRMDTDTTGGKNSHREILDEFTSGKADVLIGTQMVAKGLDIPNVTLVGVINADASLFHSDYRSSERTFQLLTQVAGRAGRAEKAGHVVVQTNAPEHRAIKLCVNHDYKSFYKLEIADRMRTLFPPFAIFIRALFVSPDEERADGASQRFAEGVSKAVLNELHGFNAENQLIFVIPGAAPIRRRAGEFRFVVMIKLARTNLSSIAVNAVYRFGDSFTDETYRGIEVNPVDML